MVQRWKRSNLDLTSLIGLMSFLWVAPERPRWRPRFLLSAVRAPGQSPAVGLGRPFQGMPEESGVARPEGPEQPRDLVEAALSDVVPQLLQLVTEELRRGFTVEAPRRLFQAVADPQEALALAFRAIGAGGRREPVLVEPQRLVVESGLVAHDHREDSRLAAQLGRETGVEVPGAGIEYRLAEAEERQRAAA